MAFAMAPSFLEFDLMSKAPVPSIEEPLKRKRTVKFEILKINIGTQTEKQEPDYLDKKRVLSATSDQIIKLEKYLRKNSIK
jgi:hypothetical protein